MVCSDCLQKQSASDTNDVFTNKVSEGREKRTTTNGCGSFVVFREFSFCVCRAASCARCVRVPFVMQSPCLSVYQSALIKVLNCINGNGKRRSVQPGAKCMQLRVKLYFIFSFCFGLDSDATLDVPNAPFHSFSQLFFFPVVEQRTRFPFSFSFSYSDGC